MASQSRQYLDIVGGGRLPPRQRGRRRSPLDSDDAPSRTKRNKQRRATKTQSNKRRKRRHASQTPRIENDDGGYQEIVERRDEQIGPSPTIDQQREMLKVSVVLWCFFFLFPFLVFLVLNALLIGLP